MDTELVWYAAYGSNLDRARLGVYLSGGRAPGARRGNPGARDGSPPREYALLRHWGTPLFGGESLTWGGGFALYDAGTTPATSSYMIGSLISWQQLADITAQEMHREPGSVELDRATLQVGRTQVIDPASPYGAVVGLGEHEGLPICTVTTPRPTEAVRREPTAAYLAVIMRGLTRDCGLDVQASAAYLASWDGIGGWSISQVEELVVA